MSKVFGLTKRYTPLREETTRIVARYGKEQYDDKNSTWYEVYFNKNQYPVVTLEDIKEAILADIDECTKEAIIGSFMWNEKPVWLSLENQSNFATAEHRAATTGDNLPYKEKIGEQEDGSPVYHTFETAAELTAFWNACQDHIDAYRRAGWELKDSIDWSDYEAYFPVSEQS